MLFEDCERLRLESANVMTAANESELTAARLSRIRDAWIGSVRIDGPGRAMVQIEPGVTGTLARTTGHAAPRFVNRSPSFQMEAMGVNRP
jgi:hypothetical protein